MAELMLRTLLTRLRARLDGGRDLFFDCCHRINGVWRAGPNRRKP